MKRSIVALGFFLAFAAAAAAQAPVSVTGTIQDTHGLKYVGSKVVFTLVSAGGQQPTLTPCSNNTAGCPFGTTSFPTTTTIGSGFAFSDGSFSVQLVPNANILPSGSTYTVTISSAEATTAPPFGTGPQVCTLTGITITTAVDLSTAINPCPALTVPFGSSAAGACNVSTLLDTWVVSIHPNATCYGSVDFTWDDTQSSSDGQNLQAGWMNVPFAADRTGNSFFLFSLGSYNTTNGTQSQNYGNSNASCSQSGAACDNLFTIGEQNRNEGGTDGLATDSVYDDFIVGASSHVANAVESYSLGFSNSITGSTNDSTNDFANYLEVFLLGDSDTVTSTGDTSNTNQVHSHGWNNTYTAQTGGLLQGIAVNGSGNTLTASSSATVDEIYDTGEKNTVTSTGSGSATEGIFILGDETSATSSSGGQHNFDYIVGRSNSLHASVNGNGTNFVTLLGRNNSATGSTTTMLNSLLAGYSVSATDCTRCFALGENITLGAANDLVAIGVSATPEVEVKPTEVDVGYLTANNFVCALTAGKLSTSGCPSTSGPQVIYTTQSSTSTGNISAVTMVSSASAMHDYLLTWTVSLTTAGTGCTGNTTVQINAIFTDPNASASITQTVGTVTIAANGNGTVGFVSEGSDNILAKSGSSVSYSTANYSLGSGCSVNPTYQLSPTLVQQW